MAVAAWLGEVGKNNKMFFFPMVFMLAATLTSLVITVINKCKAIGAGTAAWGDWFQLFFAAAMAVLAIFLVVEGAQTFAKQMKEIYPDPLIADHTLPECVLLWWHSCCL